MAGGEGRRDSPQAARETPSPRRGPAPRDAPDEAREVGGVLGTPMQNCFSLSIPPRALGPRGIGA